MNHFTKLTFKFHYFCCKLSQGLALGALYFKDGVQGLFSQQVFKVFDVKLDLGKIIG